MKIRIVTSLIVLLLGAFVTVGQQTTAFTYQGRLTDMGALPSGTYQMQFALFDAVSGGMQVGSTIENLNVSVLNGIFTVPLDFGAAAFDGADRFLGVAVRRNAGESYVTLSPRQAITGVPYATRTISAALADNATQLGGLDANGFIQNSTTQQSNTDFNISGNGVAGGSLSATSINGATVNGSTVNATTQYNLDGSRILAANAADRNLAVGLDAGAVIGAINNTFVGSNAGKVTTGGANTFVGSSVGELNTTGELNTMV
jgi:hypothetical protein